MNSLYNINRILRSENDRESEDEQRQRSEFKKRLVMPRGTSAARTSGRPQLDAILNSSQQSNSASSKTDSGLSRQRTAFPTPASVRKNNVSPSEEQDQFRRELEEYGAEMLDREAKKILGKEIHEKSEDSAERELAVNPNHKADLTIYPLDELARSLELDISNMTAADVSAHINKASVEFAKYMADRLKKSSFEADTMRDNGNYDELLCALDFMKGYSEVLFRQHADRHQLDQSFTVLRAQIISGQSAPSSSTDFIPRSDVLVVQNSNANRVGEKKSLIHDRRQKLEDTLEESSIDQDLDLSRTTTRQRSEKRVAEVNASSQAREQQKEKERREDTLSLIVQRSA